MTEDGTRIFTWNGENRLVSAAPKTPVDGDEKAEFVYDYMGRRIKKSVYLYDSGKSPAWQLEKYILFVYDGWNLIREITVASGAESSRYFVWGQDLSGTFQGAGGVGGLLSSVDNSGTAYSYLYDANGNVIQVLKNSDGSVAAHYEYDPYGNLTGSYGEYAAANPFRFSTKYKDDEAGLVYYGFRYYDPELGRWLNQDPLGEKGGRNLYIFISNNPIGMIDFLGLQWGNIDFVDHFMYAHGRDVTLSQIGLLDEVKAEIKRQEILDRFGDQIKKKASQQTSSGEFTITFEGSYDFGDIVWAMGKGVLCGDFLGTVIICGNTFEYEGEAIIQYYDEFTDPYDVLEFLYGSSSVKDAPYFMYNFANFGGFSYAITDYWNEPFSGKGTK